MLVEAAMLALLATGQAGGWKATLDVRHHHETGRAVAVQPDGKVLVGGESAQPHRERSQWLLSRYLPDGTLDAGFGRGGTVLADFSSSEPGVEEILVQPDGRILAVGAAGGAFRGEDAPYEELGIGVARFLADGTPDASYGQGGRTVVRDVDLGGGGTCLAPTAAVLQPDGKLVAVGTVGCGGEGDATQVTVVRLEADGRLDRNFDGNGSQSFGFGHCAFGTAVGLQGDGRIVIGGSDGGCYEQDSPFRVARLNPDGSFDPSFGRRGRRAIRFARPGAYVTDLVVDPAGRVLVVGAAGGGEARPRLRYAIALARLRPGGRLDRGFGSDGRRLIAAASARGQRVATAVALAPDGRIVLSGITNTPSHRARFAVARLRPAGGLDRTFGDGGSRTVRFGGRGDGHAEDLTVDGTGAVTVVGGTLGPDEDLAVTRLSPIP